MLLDRMLLVAGAVAVVAAGSAHAQPTGFGSSGATRPVRVMVGGGANVPLGDLGDQYDRGITVQGSLLLNFAGFPLNLRTDVNYARMSLKDALRNATGASYASESATLFGGLVNLTLPLGAGPIRPYIMAGLGAFNFDPADLQAAPAEGSIEFAINGGGGLQLRLFGLDAFVEARLNNVYTDKGVIDTKGIQMLPITFGVIF